MDENRYYKRCIKMLKDLNAPIDGWECVDMTDRGFADFICELCGYNAVRYVHRMRHKDYFDDLEVGCICAGVMEGNILAAKERDRKFRNRVKRRSNFPRRKWKKTLDGNYYLKYRGETVFINHNGNYYNCVCGNKRVYIYKGKGINNFISACYAAFDLVDPMNEVWE